MRDENFSETAPTGEGAADNPFLKLTRFGVPDDDAAPDFDDGDDASASQARTGDGGATDGVPMLRCVGMWEDIKDSPVSWSEGKNQKSDIARKDGTWRTFFHDVVTRPHALLGLESDKGNGWTLTPSTMRDYSRVIDDKGRWAGKNLNDGNVAEITVLIFDIDNKEGAMQRPEDIAPRFRDLGVAYGWYSTASSTPALPKLRVVIAIDKPVPINGAEDAEAYSEAYCLVGNALGLRFDGACKNVSRFYYGAAFRSAPFKCSIDISKHGLPAFLAANKVEYPAWRKKAVADAGAFSGFVEGGALNFFEIVEHVRARRAARGETVKDNKKKHAKRDADAHPYEGEEWWKGDAEATATVNWLNRHPDFEAADWYRSLGHEERYEHKNKADTGIGIDAICPRADEHTAPDDGKDRAFWIMNRVNKTGKWAARCKHTGCMEASGNDHYWYIHKARMNAVEGIDSLAKFSETARQEKEVATEIGERPGLKVSASFDLMMHTTIKVMRESKRAGGSPFFYESMGKVARLRKEDDGDGLRCERLEKDDVSVELNRIIDWRKTIDKGGGTKNVAVPGNIVKEIASSIYLGMPRLKSIVRAPLITPDGKLITAAGYDEASGVYLHPVPGFVPLAVSDKPSLDDVMAARDLLFDLIRDFPFTDNWDGADDGTVYLATKDADGYPPPNMRRGRAARANALAMILHPHLAAIIDDATPMYMVDAAEPGSGKGYLTNVAAGIAEGRESEKTAFTTNSEELRKKITSAVLSRSQIFLLDNINAELCDPTLEAAITAGVWTDRILGRNDAAATIKEKMRLQFIGTVNQGSVGRDMRRRVCPIRLDAMVPDPARDRNADQFKHRPLMGAVLRERARLLQAVHTLILYWFAKGKSSGAGRPLESFESWSAVMGGILEAAEVDSFMGNLDNWRAGRGTGGPDGAFVQEWWKAFGTDPKAATALYFTESAMFGHDGGQETFKYPEITGFEQYRDPNPVKRLGRCVSRMVGRTFDVIGADDKRADKGRVRVRVMLAPKSTGASQPYCLHVLARET